jgi:hypothetical protein
VEPQSSPIPAKIVRGLKNEQVKEDDFIVLKALVVGSPSPRVNINLLYTLCAWILISL